MLIYKTTLDELDEKTREVTQVTSQIKALHSQVTMLKAERDTLHEKVVEPTTRTNITIGSYFTKYKELKKEVRMLRIANATMEQHLMTLLAILMLPRNDSTPPPFTTNGPLTVGVEAINAEVQATSLMMKNLCKRRNKIHEE